MSIGNDTYEIPAKKITATPPMPPGDNRYFVLSYNNPLAVLDVIADTKPEFVVLAGVYNKSVTDQYHVRGLKAIAYIPTNYGNTDVRLRIKSAIDGGNDGVFFDEVNPSHMNTRVNYAEVKAFGKIVIQNPGTANGLERLFDYADIVCVENYWFVDLKPYGVSPKKLMAVQGDPAGNTDPAFQSPQTLDAAVKRMKTFRENGGQWYYPGYNNTHWQLPPYLSEFAKQAK